MSDSTEADVERRKLDTDRGDPAEQIAEIVADLEETDYTQIGTVYRCIDDVLAEIFSTPPAPEARVEVTFSYEGYRITVDQTGHAEFVEECPAPERAGGVDPDAG